MRPLNHEQKETGRCKQKKETMEESTAEQVRVLSEEEKEERQRKEKEQKRRERRRQKLLLSAGKRLEVLKGTTSTWKEEPQDSHAPIADAPVASQTGEATKQNEILEIRAAPPPTTSVEPSHSHHHHWKEEETQDELPLPSTLYAAADISASPLTSGSSTPSSFFAQDTQQRTTSHKAPQRFQRSLRFLSILALALALAFVHTSSSAFSSLFPTLSPHLHQLLLTTPPVYLFCSLELVLLLTFYAWNHVLLQPPPNKESKEEQEDEDAMLNEVLAGLGIGNQQHRQLLFGFLQAAERLRWWWKGVQALRSAFHDLCLFVFVFILASCCFPAVLAQLYAASPSTPPTPAE
ncbi:hypothetical protein QOT17_015905 [Balamuthia mandrillaris]